MNEQLLESWLNQATTSGASECQLDVVVSHGAVELRRWLVVNPAPPGRQAPRSIAAKQAVRDFFGYLPFMRGPDPRFYTAQFLARNGAWILAQTNFVGTIISSDGDALPAARVGRQRDEDEAALIIADVRAQRQLVLSTAALLIAEQDPRRLENIVATVAPFAIVRIARLGRLARLRRFREIRFVGLINNRRLQTLTQQEIRNAFSRIGLREAHNSHFISRLVERGHAYGINSLDDFSRAYNRGITRVGHQPNTIEVVLPDSRAAVVLNEAEELVTLLPLRGP